MPVQMRKTLRLREPSRNIDGQFKVCQLKLTVPTLCRYYCPTDGCNGNNNGVAVEDDGRQTGLPLGGRGRAPAGEGLLCLCLATQPWAAAHTSQGDNSLLMGICLNSAQLYLDESRRKMAQLNIIEQRSLKFKRGMLVEWDECGIRAEHVRCDSPCRVCTL